MTFLEAAIEILRNEEEPLHFSEIAKRAVSNRLLSHVGRDPEAAMRSCLTSAVRSSGDALLERVKPGHYRIRPGAQLPPPAQRPSGATGNGKAPAAASPTKSGSESAAGGAPRGLPVGSVAGEADAPRTRSRKKTSKKGAKKAPKKVEIVPGDSGDPKDDRAQLSSEPTPTADPAEVRSASTEDGTDEGAEGAGAVVARAGGARGERRGESGEPASRIEFVAPEGSGLEGVTDVALVMANAMSRLADERPELREELEAMQAAQGAHGHSPHGTTGEPIIEARAARGRTEPVRRDDERTGRRRRRRRRRGRRVEWMDPADRSSPTARRDDLLARVEKVLEEAGPRSLHVRQISEALAASDVLGGEISEIERAVTAAILLDVQTKGRASRFAVRGDARYQLHGARVPKPAADAEKAFKNAALALESETRAQVYAWLGSLGARALETIVRIYLDTEGYALIGALPPGRGLGKLLVEDPEADEDERKTLVLVVPSKTQLEPRLWEGEAERAGCSAAMVVTTGDPAAIASAEIRVISAHELVDWALRRGVGVTKLELVVPVLDPAVIESIGGLDT